MKDTTVIFDLGNVIVLYDENIIAHRFAEAYSLDKAFLYQTKPLLEQIVKQFDEGKISPETLTRDFSSVLNVPLDIEQFRTIWCEDSP